MKKERKISVGISVGDLNGIGVEVILKTFEDNRMLDFCTPVLFASIKTISYLKKHYNSKINFNSISKINQLQHNKVNVLNVWNEGVNISFGQEDSKVGEYAIKSLKSAVQHLKQEDIDVLVTAPIHKHNIQSENFKFPGHTDFLNEQLDGESLMFMISNNLRVGLLTDHVPVNEVSNHINESLINKKVNTVYNSLKQDFGISKPKIAVLAINPHAGDNGVIGKEDDTILRPTIQKIREEGKLVYGPYSADSFFGSGNYKSFDAILASYHDQGLIPFKTIAFGNGVNYTAGLNRVRTSPDHGTAFEIAGKNEADESSFKEAVFSAIQIFKSREQFKKYSNNPLKVSSK